MSLLSRIAVRRAPGVDVPELPTECGHWEMAPRWDNAADIGRKDRITSYTCTNCKESFTPDEAERFAV